LATGRGKRTSSALASRLALDIPGPSYRPSWPPVGCRPSASPPTPRRWPTSSSELPRRHPIDRGIAGRLSPPFGSELGPWRLEGLPTSRAQAREAGGAHPAALIGALRNRFAHWLPARRVHPPTPGASHLGGRVPRLALHGRIMRPGRGPCA